MLPSRSSLILLCVLMLGLSEPSGGYLTVPAELQLSWRFSRVVGIGTYVFASLGNDEMVGATLAFEVGRLR